METKQRHPTMQRDKTSLSGRGLLVVVNALALICVTMLIFLKSPPKRAVTKPSAIHAGAPDGSTPSAGQPRQASAAEAAASPAQTAGDNSDPGGKAEEAATA